MSLGMYVESCGSLHVPLPGLLFYLIIYVELGQEGLEITLVLDEHKSSLEVLSEGHILVDISLAWCLSYSYTD